MMYWEDMLEKYGFSDGASTPPDALHRRDVYVRAINTLAVRYSSRHRVIPFDRVGAHNSVLVTFVTADWFDREYMPRQSGTDISKLWEAFNSDNFEELLEHGHYVKDCDIDAGMRKAIRVADMLYDLEDYVITEVRIDPKFYTEFLPELLTEDLGDAEACLDDEQSAVVVLGGRQEDPSTTPSPSPSTTPSPSSTPSPSPTPSPSLEDFDDEEED